MRSLSIVLENDRLDFSAKDSAAAGLAIITSLLGTSNTSRSCPSLKSLHIQSLSFKSIGAILPTVLTLDHLEDLRLIKCLDTNRFYETLSLVKPPLNTFTDERSSNSPFHVTTNTLLRSLAPLRKLRISVERNTKVGETLKWSSLLQHASRIEVLEINDWKIDPDGLLEDTTLPALDAFCKDASRLQQLSIQGPELDEYSKSSYWAQRAKVFLVSNAANLLHGDPSH